MELEVFFTLIQQTYSKIVISFMNRKSSCGYATHFFYMNLIICQYFLYIYLFNHLYISIEQFYKMEVQSTNPLKIMKTSIFIHSKWK
jgi:hypothetical protein